ncbi:uncharacterized protein N7473_003528 [Penicillium subrubescens]|uniref:uncharacterized protein n=1 Tax=Penicillium subrubescens TaxID=1316194 RepID=UPI00254566BC|nr:uncharacterized protein N7473_003528 [Penicillium subrubescens]KAJ5906612.1 hypothetical protein N7473_003528 [Penicillium subrubescens]
MKSILLLSALCARASAFSIPDGHPLVHWRPAGPGDVRSPCPMLNALANHGLLPHDGKNITEEQTANALKLSINLNEDVAKSQFQEALATNPTPGATTFSLDDLSRHNIIEHDASLSRQDHYFGDDQNFNPVIFDQTRSHWKGLFINVHEAALARKARVETSNATNPEFTLSKSALTLTYGESAVYIVTFGDRSAGTVRKSWVEYFFEFERLPTELGWTKHEDEITSSDLNSMAQRVIDATESSDEEKHSLLRRRDFHAGHTARRHHH